MMAETIGSTGPLSGTTPLTSSTGANLPWPGSNQGASSASCGLRRDPDASIIFGAPGPTTTAQAGPAPRSPHFGGSRRMCASCLMAGSSPYSGTGVHRGVFRGVISVDGVTWREKDVFTIREGGAASTDIPQYFHIGYPTVTQASDSTVVTAYHYYMDNPEPGQPIQAMWATRFRV